MSILSDFEDRVAHGVEGMFAGVFRSPVQPAELARACAKEMDRRRKLGVGKVYAPTMYSVLLSAEDGDQLGGFAATLAGELETYLVGHAREKDYNLATRPRVRFLVDDGLKLGRFEIIGEILSEDEIEAELGEGDGYYDPDAESASAAAAAPAPELGVVPASAPAAPYDFEAGETHYPMRSVPSSGALATVTIVGVQHDIALSNNRTVIGRLKACDVCLPDANTSREHAVIRHDETGWFVEDLGSTNGTMLNGKRIDRERLHDGDRITIGVSELIFNEPRG